VETGGDRGSVQQVLVSLTHSFTEQTLTENSMISYPNYKFIFPIKALGMYAKRFGNEPL
jgi:squalene cyclase